MKFLIVLVYYERPNIVLNALNGINAITYSDFELAILDDGSINRIEPIARKILRDDILQRTTFHYINDSIEYKKQHGSRHAAFINTLMDASTADAVIINCDDDVIIADSLSKLKDWFEANPQEYYTYGHVITFDPTKDNYLEAKPKEEWLNKTGRISPSCQVDSSQVIFRMTARKAGVVEFPAQTAAADSIIFSQLFNAYGPCAFCGFFVQYKGIFPDQLGTRKSIFDITNK